jgi:hypothetical protein
MTPEQAGAVAEAIGFVLPEDRRAAAAEIVSGLLSWAHPSGETDEAPEPAVRFGDTW